MMGGLGLLYLGVERMERWVGSVLIGPWGGSLQLIGITAVGSRVCCQTCTLGFPVAAVGG